MIVDLFGGPGGWSEGLRSLLGLTDVGIEWDTWACATRAAAGHPTIRADVASWPAANLYGRLEGVICSSPCPDFSKAGKRAGLKGPTGWLVFETLRWAEEARPRWIAAENVPEVAPIFLSFRAPLAALGYSVWSGILDAADYGVPQNRKRAFLLASLDRSVSPPPPTHSKTGHAEMFDARARWVSMAEALPHLFPDELRPARTVAGNRLPRWLYEDRDGTHGQVMRTGSNTQMGSGRRSRYERPVDRPAPTVDGKAGRSAWKLDRRRPEGVAPLVSSDRPSPTVTSEAGHQAPWTLRHPGRSYGTTTTTTTTEPAPCVALGHNSSEWCWERPATTVQGTPRVAPPGHHEAQWRDAIKVELWELGVLQGFPSDYPWQGNKTERARQIGNAVPPPMAAALVRALTS